MEQRLVYLHPVASEDDEASDEDGYEAEQVRLSGGEAFDPGLRRAPRSAIVACATLLAAAALLWGRRSGQETTSRGQDIVSLSGSEDHCHTAVEGETCWIDVRWAMTDGIVNHADWYAPVCPFLRHSSSFEEFQVCIFKINQTKCALPCNPAGTVKKPVVDLPESHSEVEGVDEQRPCHIAKPGDDCYNSVIEAMKTGITREPVRFQGLNLNSSFEEFQAALFQDPASTSCPRPCECKTAGKGDKCYDHVQWVRKTGFDKHSDWYDGLHSDSPFEDIQGFLHKGGKGSCGLPCAPRPDVKSVENLRGGRDRVEDKTKVEKEIAESLDRVGTLGVASEDGVVSEDEEKEQHDMECQTAKKGSSCYNDVQFAMGKGVEKHPEWYPGLTKFSRFEDFQRVIHNKNLPNHRCPRPCTCHTAQKGEECHEKVRWVVREGIEAHPSWYQGLTTASRWEEVQSRLQEDEKTTCKTPCSIPEWGKPSLFCFSVFRSTGYEVDLVKAQVEKQVGIFKCDEFAVLSDRELPITEDITTLMIPPCEQVGKSKDGTAANTEIFMKAWGVIWKEAKWRAHDWIIKADPDAVVLVDRLRKHLEPHTGKQVYMKNCQKYFGPGWPMMYGSLEAFSRLSMEAYFKGAQDCRDKLEWSAWGEDLFMGRCLDMLKSGSAFDGHLIGDNVCKGANCGDGVTAVYHPFKSAETWFQCYNQAVR